MTDASVSEELKEVEMKTEDQVEEENATVSHPLFDEAVEEEDIRPEQAIIKFKQVIDERQILHTNTPDESRQWLKASLIHLFCSNVLSLCS